MNVWISEDNTMNIDDQRSLLISENKTVKLSLSAWWIHRGRGGGPYSYFSKTKLLKIDQNCQDIGC